VLQVTGSVHYADQVNSVLQRKVKEEEFLKAVRNGESPHTLKFRLGDKDTDTTLGLVPT
jgi:hypothetical protein